MEKELKEVQYCLPIYIPRMHLSVSLQQIKHVMEYWKIGVVSNVYFIYFEHHKSAFVYFQYHYPTKDTSQLLRQLKDGDYFKLYPFVDSWMYWKLFKAFPKSLPKALPKEKINTHTYFNDENLDNNLEEPNEYEYDSV